jgi:DNA-binding transcriptional MerR regulator
MTNPPERRLTTGALGRLVGYSTQQVRDLERLGVIPRAQRAANGYRGYDDRHVVALQAYRAVAAAIGPVPARRLLPGLLAGTVEDAAEAIDELHAAIAHDRVAVREARRGLAAVLTDATDVFEERDAMTIGELADALGVRASALRHWEDQDLVGPDRTAGARTRRYHAPAIAEARIVAALRAGGYGIPQISRVLNQLRTHGLTVDAEALLDARLADLSRRSVRLLEAAGHLHALLRSRAETQAEADSEG